MRPHMDSSQEKSPAAACGAAAGCLCRGDGSDTGSAVWRFWGCTHTRALKPALEWRSVCRWQGEIPAQSNGLGFFELPVSLRTRFTLLLLLCGQLPSPMSPRALNTSTMLIIVSASHRLPPPLPASPAFTPPRKGSPDPRQVFNYHEGYLSVNCSTNYYFSSQRHPEVPRLTQAQLDAIPLFNQVGT